MSSRSSLSIILVCALLPLQAFATTRTWPGVSPCAGTLQACVDGATNGDRIEIATNTAITEDLNLYNRSLTLTAADGYAPNLGAGHWLSITSAPIAGDMQVSVSRLHLYDGYVYVSYNGTGTATYDLRQLTVTRISSDTANYIQVAASQGTVNATLYDNRVSGVPSSLNNGLIQLLNSGATLNASVYNNHVSSTSPTSVSGSGILADVHSGGSGTLKLHGNEVHGGFYRAGIYVSEGLFSTTTSAVVARVYNNVAVCNSTANDGSGGTGIGFVANNGSIDVQAINNTVSNCFSGVSVTQWSGGGATASIAGTFSSNLLVAYNALALNPTVPGARTNDYNLINSTTAIVAYGSHTLTGPANLVSATQPRLRMGSPAINAADNATLGFGLLFNGLPTTDADGLRRFKGASGVADIGAYEYGDTSFTHVTGGATIIDNFSVVDNAALNGNPGTNLIATPNYNIGNGSGMSYDAAFGAFYTSPNWAMFNQDSASSMPAGVHFDIFAPAPAGGSFVHVSSASTASGYASTISDASIDGLADRIVLVTQNWTAGGSGVYNAHPVGVYYGSDMHWHVANVDGAAMPLNLGFNVYAQEPSPNAFRVTASTGNLVGNSIMLDHPLLNGTPCARPHVTRLLGSGTVTGNFDLAYSLNHWYIYGYTPILVSEQFHVLVDPAQIEDCTDRIFANGFD